MWEQIVVAAVVGVPIVAWIVVILEITSHLDDGHRRLPR